MYLLLRLPIVLRRLMCGCVLVGFFFCGLPAQTTFKVNVLVDAEFSKAGSKSHYYYNEIDKDFIKNRLGIPQLNLTGKVRFNSQWSFNTRLLLKRDKGQELQKFVIPQLNIKWLSKKRKFGFTLGSFTNPFGSFNQKQLSTRRNFVGIPLAYAYYVNISDKIGFMEGMGDINKIPIDSTVQWGTTNLYYGGYTTGGVFSWNIKPAKIHWEIAVVTGASNLQKKISIPYNYGIISKLKIQPTYFWEQGFSISHGTFLQASEVSHQLENLKAFKQTVVGVDFKTGSGFFEFSGEVIGTFYAVPVFNSEDKIFEARTHDVPQKLSNLAVYLDFKYEPPILQGSYVAYRIDHLRFGKLDNNSNQSWDNNVLRHSIALGYHINKHLLTKIGLSTQHVDNKNWNKKQRTLRLILTAHY